MNKIVKTINGQRYVYVNNSSFWHLVNRIAVHQYPPEGSRYPLRVWTVI